MFKLDNRLRSFSGHVVNGVLVTEPIGTFNGVVHMPMPVIRMHVSESSVNTTLGSNSVRTSREELGDTSSLETSFGKTESSTETGTTGTND